MSNKFYAVKRGKKPGIYSSWNECKNMVEGFSGAVYKGFSSKKDAESFLNEDDIPSEVSDENKVIAYVDGSYSKEYGKYAYGCVIRYNGKQVELSGVGNDEKYLEMNNVAGELLASISAIKWAINSMAKNICIYHDYEGIAKWANGEWKAKKNGTKEYQQFIEKCKSQIGIEFVKVSAHTGIELNERADYLAKQALTNEKEDKITLVERYFLEYMTLQDEAMDENCIQIGNYMITNKRVNKYVKHLWSLSGRKKTDIKKMKYHLDCNQKKMSVVIVTADGNVHEDEIKLINIL